MAERSKASHSRCDVATLVGSNPTLCIFYYKIQPRIKSVHQINHISQPEKIAPQSLHIEAILIVHPQQMQDISEPYPFQPVHQKVLPFIGVLLHYVIQVVVRLLSQLLRPFPSHMVEVDKKTHFVA